MKKLLLIGVALLLMANTIYLPIVNKSRKPVYEWHQCTWDLHGTWGFQAGQVHAWIKVEYHPDGPVRLVQFYDTFDPPTYTWTYYKWYARPFRSYPWWSEPYELNLLWVAPINDMNNWSTYVESITKWEAVTHLGSPQIYILEINAPKKGHIDYPVKCLWWID